MARITQSAFAKKIGVSRQAVNQAVKPGGKLAGQLGTDGKLNLEDATYRWNTRKRTKITDAPVDADQDGDAYHRARTAKAQQDARLAKLKADKQSGKLLDADLVQAFVLGAHSAAVARLRGVPAQWSDELAPITDAHDMRIALERVFTEVAGLIADDIAGLA